MNRRAGMPDPDTRHGAVPGSGSGDTLATGPQGDGRAAERGVVDSGAAGDAPDAATGIAGLRASGRGKWYAGSVVGLSFLVVYMVQVATGPASTGAKLVFEVSAACFAAVYILAPVRVTGGSAFGAAGGVVARLVVLAAMVMLTVPMIIISGPPVTSLWIYVGVVGAVFFSLRTTLVVALVLAAGMVAVFVATGDDVPWELALTLVALSLWMAGFANNIRLNMELRATRDELARAAVAAERSRIARDLHDILGHSLTAITVKAGLARRLIGSDPSAAAVEVADIERLARDSLADVRATTAGYRDVSLAGEIAVARSVLTAAGIHADVPTAVDEVNPTGRLVFGYVVREAVTNVVRHSGARRCSVTLTPDSITVVDDGEGPRRAGGHGSGLRGLAERLSAVGGTLETASVDGGGFRVTATVTANTTGSMPGGGAP